MSGLSSKALAFGTPENKLKYNGKEEQRNEFSDGSGLEWLDYGARMYDGQIGRWSVVDPLAELSKRWNPYSYSYNNPLFFIDPEGMIPEEATYQGVRNKQYSFGVKDDNSEEESKRKDNMPQSLNISDENGYRFFTDPDFAAVDWAIRYSANGNDGFNEEISSLLFEVVHDGTKYYSYTDPVQWPDPTFRGVKSPGIENPIHKALPTGAKKIGFIHLHWKGSESEHESNISFSDMNNGRGDVRAMQNYPNMKFYVIGSTGILWGRVPSNTAPKDPSNPNDNDKGTKYKLLSGLYNINRSDIKREGRMEYTPNSKIAPCWINSIKKPK